jgi:hypothetical protein
MKKHKAIQRALYIFILIGALIWNISYYSNISIDDSYITVRYSEIFSRTGSFLYSNGERSEGFSNPIWMALIALSERLGFQASIFIRSAAIVLYILLIALTSFIINQLTINLKPKGSSHTLVSYFIPILYLAVSPVFGFYACSGMETIQFVFVVALSFYAAAFHNVRRANAILITSSILVVFTRPEGFAYLPFIWLARIVCAYNLRDCVAQFRKDIGIYIYPISALIAITIFRYLYFGRPLPLTVYAKSESINTTITYGFKYLSQYLSHWANGSWVYGLAAIITLLLLSVRHSENKKILIGFSLMAIGNIAFIFLSGEDWMPNARFLILFDYFICLLVAFTLITIHGEKGKKNIGYVGFASAYIAAIFLIIGNIFSGSFIRWRDVHQSTIKKDFSYSFQAIREHKYLTPFITGSVPVNMYDLLFPYAVEHIPPSSIIALPDIGYITYILESNTIDTNGLVTPVITDWLALAKKHGVSVALQPSYTFNAYSYFDKHQPDWVFLRWHKDDKEPALWAEKLIWVWMQPKNMYELISEKWVPAENTFIRIYKNNKASGATYDEIQKNYLRLLKTVPNIDKVKNIEGYTEVWNKICGGNISQSINRQISCN